MKFIWFLSFFILEFVVFLQANPDFQFGILNNPTEWTFHCPQNHTKTVKPSPTNQPLIPYECPIRSSTIQILPLEIDITFLCRSQSRLIWIIVDFYQYNTDFSLFDTNDYQIRIHLNHQIDIQQSKIERKNFTNRLIIVNAFYIPFESANSILNQQIHISIQIQNPNQLNWCQFEIKDNLTWESFLQQKCNQLDQLKTYTIQSAQCDFYSKEIPTTTTVTTTTDSSNINQTKFSFNYDHHHYLLSEEKYHKLLATISRSTLNAILLQLIFIFLLIILVVLTLFFVYMLCYHYHDRTQSSLLIPQSSSSL